MFFYQQADVTHVAQPNGAPGGFEANTVVQFVDQFTIIAVRITFYPEGNKVMQITVAVFGCFEEVTTPGKSIC